MDESLPDQIEIAAQWLAESDHPVFFTGAGISTDSGLPDYRGPDGVWTRRDRGLPPPKWKKPLSQIRPNAAHYALVKLQRLGRLAFLISQNVDNLHLESGIEPGRLAELHGNSALMRCVECERVWTRREVGWDRDRWGPGYRTEAPRRGQPRCPSCEGRLVSTVVNFGDSLPERELELATDHSRRCDLFFAVGSSLVVSPANEMPRVALRNGARLILLNMGETPFDQAAHLRISAAIGEVLPAVATRVEALIGGT